MIFLTRMDKQLFYINPDHIVSIEETPDTVITLFNGHHFIVKESARAIIDKIVSFRSRIIRRSGGTTGRRRRITQRKALFRSATLNRQVMPLDGSVRTAAQPHTRDF